QLRPGAGLQRFDRCARVEPVELGTGEGFAVLAVHGWLETGWVGAVPSPACGHCALHGWEVPEGRWGRARSARRGSDATLAPTPALPRTRGRERSGGSAALVDRHEGLV